MRGGAKTDPALETRSQRVALRVTPSTKAVLQRAAAASRKSLTEFLLDAGLTAAEQALAEHRVFRLDDAQWRAFEAASIDPSSPSADWPV